MIIGFVENLGKGKTLGATYLGYYFKEKTKLSNVVSNYETDLTTHYVDNPTDLERMSQEVEGIYLLDEIWAWMSAREAMENDEMIDFVINARKRGCLVIYTVQNLKLADNVLTDITDYFAIPNHVEAHKTGKPHDIAEIQFVTDDGNLGKTFKYNAEKFYGSYDTSEEISSKTDAEMYKDVIDEVKQKFRDNEFEHKKEAVGYLELHTDLSHSKKDAIVDEAYRAVKSDNKDNGGDNNNEQLPRESLKRFK